MSTSRSVHVRSVSAIEAKRSLVFVWVATEEAPVSYFALSSPDGFVLPGHDGLIRLMLALGKRLALEGGCDLTLVARDQMPDGVGGFEDAVFTLSAYFENGAPISENQVSCYYS